VVRQSCVEKLLSEVWVAPALLETAWRFTQPDQKKKETGTSYYWICRKQVTPLLMYCYLKSRFGSANGVQMLLKNQHADNLIHWEYHIKVGDHDIVFTGFYFYFTVLISNIEKKTGRDEASFFEFLKK
jgi:hypothetical protein